MYYLTVYKNERTTVYRKPFEDYSEAVAYTSQFYRRRGEVHSTLKFTTEVVDGELARSYAELLRPEDLDANDPHYTGRYAKAAIQSNAFVFDNSWFFMIETGYGILDSERWHADEGEG